MEEFNILFTSAGKRIALIRDFKKALIELNLSGKIIVADRQKNIPTAFIADCYEAVPPVNSDRYISSLQEICQKHRIKLIVPLIDSELYILSRHQQLFDDMGVMVLVSSPQTNEICFDKRNTYTFFKSFNIATPEILNLETILSQPITNYPLLIKPANGSCSVGVTKINNQQELVFFYDYIPNSIIQEFVVGQEFTNDVLVDRQGKVRCVVPRLRMETRAGEVCKGMTVKNREIMAATQKVVEALPGAFGCITVQCFLLPNLDIKFIEINPRFGGGIPLSIQAGADFPRWIIEMSLDRPITMREWQDGVVMLRYDDSVFVTKEMI